MRILKYGVSGPDVTALQYSLVALNLYPAAKVDGKFANLTQDAVKKFQTSAGLNADGIVGPLTAEALNIPWAANVDSALIKQSLSNTGKDFLTDEEANKIARWLNGLVDAPLIPEGVEQFVLVKVVRLLDRAMDKIFPDEIYHAIRDTALGIMTEPSKYRQRIIDGLNRNVGVWFLDEAEEAKLIGHFVDLVLDGIQIGKSILKNSHIN